MTIIPEPIQAWLQSINGLEILLTLIALVALIKMLWKWIKHLWPGLKKFIAFFDALARLPTFMVESMTADRNLRTLVMEVRHEVLPNNGKSLRDDVVTIALRQESMAAKQANDYERFLAIEDELKTRSRNSLGIPPATNPRLRAVRDRDTSDERNDDV